MLPWRKPIAILCTVKLTVILVSSRFSTTSTTTISPLQSLFFVCLSATKCTSAAAESASAVRFLGIPRLLSACRNKSNLLMLLYILPHHELYISPQGRFCFSKMSGRHILLQRQTESELLLQVHGLQKRCAELEKQASQAKISGAT